MGTRPYRVCWVSRINAARVLLPSHREQFVGVISTIRWREVFAVISVFGISSSSRHPVLISVRCALSMVAASRLC
eukprot:7399438-Pyramimonas_sp.AAC.1